MRIPLATPLGTNGTDPIQEAIKPVGSTASQGSTASIQPSLFAPPVTKFFDSMHLHYNVHLITIPSMDGLVMCIL